MNNDANPVTCYEPNAAAGQGNLGSDFTLAGAAERAARTGSVFGGSDQGAASAAFPPPWPGLGLNLLGPTFRAETQHGAAADPTCSWLQRKTTVTSAGPTNNDEKKRQNKFSASFNKLPQKSKDFLLLAPFHPVLGLRSLSRSVHTSVQDFAPEGYF